MLKPSEWRSSLDVALRHGVSASHLIRLAPKPFPSILLPPFSYPPPPSLLYPLSTP